MEAPGGSEGSTPDNICLRSVLNAIEGAIVVVNKNDVILASSDKADRLLGKGELLRGR